MIPGLDILAFAGLLTLAADPVVCQVPRAPTVTVLPTTDALRYDNTVSVKDLSRIRTDTMSPYDKKHAEHLMFGLHHGRIALSAKTSVGWQTYRGPSASVGCMYYDSVEIRINLSPVIYIAKEFPKGSCAYKAVLEHEKKHARVDRFIANKYAQRIGHDVRSAVNEMGAAGPYPESQMKTLQNKMVGYVRSTVDSLDLLMSEEQARLQQQVDSLQEYQHVSSVIREQCKIDSRAFLQNPPSRKGR